MVFTFRRALRPLVLIGAAVLLAIPLTAHDDDPKILSVRGPVASPGFRPAAFLAGGSLAPMAGIGASQLGSQLNLSTLSDTHIQFPASGVHLVSWLPLAQLSPGAFTGNDCWGYVSPSGREYALMGLSDGTAFVEITNPSDPVIVAHLPGESSLWRDVKIYQEYAYMVSEGGGGIQVVDLGQIDAGAVTLANTIFSGGNADSHNVAIDTTSGFLYRCGGGGGQGLRIYNLNNPASPSFVGSWNGRYVHDVQVVTYTSGPYAGREIAFCCSGFGNGSGSTGVTVLDVTNKNNISTRDQFYYPNPAYSHQAWLSPDRTKLFLNDELDEDGMLPTTTHVIDVTNVDSLQHLGTFTNNNTAIGHNLYTKDDLLYEANYRSGLRIFDVSGAPNATEVAYFDTWPGDNSPSFNGLWSCFPYFPSGLVIGSDLERGLFVWWIGAPKIDITLALPAPAVMSPAGTSLTVQLSELSAGDLLVGSEKLYFDDGSGLQELPLVSQGAGSYLAQFPATACGGTMRWFVGARSTDGILWTLPASAPYDHFEMLVADNELVFFEDDFEQDLGWTVGGPNDTATSGIWRRGDPVESSVSPEDDHTLTGTECYMTGTGGDLDGGLTTLTSPVFDLRGWGDPVISFWLYFSTDGFSQAGDQIIVDVTGDGGANWVDLERIHEVPLEQEATWMHLSYHLSDVLTPGESIQVRFRARDGNLDTDVKALVDDFRITQADCPCQMNNYCSSAPNSSGTSALISASGSASVSANNFSVDVTGAVPGGLGLFFYGVSQEQLPLGEGTLCVSGGGFGVHRLQPPLAVDAMGSGTRYLDLTQAPASSGPGAIAPGTTVNFQFWYRDPAGGPAGFNFSNGLEVTFCQ